jgi:exodeoxyribonuclease V alpha subunit
MASDILERIRTSEDFDDLAFHFASFVRDHSAAHGDVAALSAALVSRELTSGHICLNLRKPSSLSAPDEAGGVDWLKLPEYTVLRKRLLSSGMVSEASGELPLVLEGERLYLQRYWKYEKRIADELLRRALAAPDSFAGSGDYLDRLFPAEDEALQKLAAGRALSRSLSVISGGPGTGKTTTVARIIFLLLLREPGTEIALAAPTGKAAARMMEAISSARVLLEERLKTGRGSVSAEEKKALDSMAALQGLTLHRLMGARPDSPVYRHNESNPLRISTLIVDEASMIDAAMMAKLLSALPERCRCVFLGDRDQLASVEAGAVLADICSSALEGGGALRDNVTVLEKSWRFAQRPGIGLLSSAVNRGDDMSVIGKIFMENDSSSGISLTPLERSASLRDILRPLVISGFRGFIEAQEPGQALEALGRFRILSPLREGAFGVLRLNALIEDILAREGLISIDSPMYINRPVMITRNDHQLGLFNGDTGIVRQDSLGRRRVFFPGGADGNPRAVMPSLLPDHETVYAMTVHKSQGSEFDDVLMLLPDRDAPVLTRELLYTGITRARRNVNLLCTDRSLAAAVSRKVARASGLEERLL